MPHVPEPIASLGRVLGDRSTLYKYLNGAAQIVTTVTPSSRSASVCIVDTVKGSVIYSAKLSGVDTDEGIHATFSENWLVFEYAANLPDAGRQYRAVSVELYERDSADKTWEWRCVLRKELGLPRKHADLNRVRDLPLAFCVYPVETSRALQLRVKNRWRSNRHMSYPLACAR